VRWAGVALAGALLFSGCKKKDTPEPERTATKPDADIVLGPGLLDATTLRSEKPRMVPRRTGVVVAGTLEFVPNRVARVGPLIEGRVTQIRVDPGQRVVAGTILAAVDSVEVGRARADYLSSQVKVEFAARERDRQRNLADSGLSSGQSVLAAENQTDLAMLEKRAAAERLSAVGVRADDLNAQGEGKASRPSTATLLKTPLGGLVLDVNARIGQAVSSTDTLFTVGEIDKVWLIVDVYERDLARVHTGDNARAKVISYKDREFSGVVDYVGGIVDPVRKAVPARVVLDNPEGLLRPGMSATANVFGEQSAAADAGPCPSADVRPCTAAAGKSMMLVVPRSAVQTIDGQAFVFLDKGDGKYDLRPVVPGDTVDQDIEILRGLTEAESIAVESTFILKSEALRAQMGSND
jgi:cobalt-zinc-cadmium efflux system membrane fusion protein